MKKAELILAILILTGIVLSVLHLPGGAMLLVLTMPVLSMMYLCLGFALLNGIPLKNESYKGLSTMRIVGSVLSGIVFSIALIGILFVWMMWPGASVMLLSSIAGLLIMLIVVLIKYFTKKNLFYRNMLIRIAVIGIPVLLLFADPSLAGKIKYGNNPELIQAIQEAEANPENEELWRKVDSIKGLRYRGYQQNNDR
ncbi:hypothetical protein [Flavobacterium beibuense]|uniref:Uncharacterized protein n=1 Tax=Flavobacterium beibuense TaxID=657326 RepID=A0A444WBJ5_9FLAO|nr:hypothetical protein [Flavobacterium beibuense]RYJ43197.1 hypothetical protein NU09_1535 [Flavobacterium beibuense]